MSASKLVLYSLVCGVPVLCFSKCYFFLLYLEEVKLKVLLRLYCKFIPNPPEDIRVWTGPIGNSEPQMWQDAGLNLVNSQIFLSVGSHTFMYRDLMHLQMHWSLIPAVGWTEMFSCVKKTPPRIREPENRLYTYNLVSLPRKEKLLLWFNPKRDWTGQVYKIWGGPPLNIEMLLVLPENKLHTSEYPSCFLHSQWQ